jgi:hypothetical protein
MRGRIIRYLLDYKKNQMSFFNCVNFKKIIYYFKASNTPMENKNKVMHRIIAF